MSILSLVMSDERQNWLHPHLIAKIQSVKPIVISLMILSLDTGTPLESLSSRI
jgi:hypothetical protein